MSHRFFSSGKLVRPFVSGVIWVFVIIKMVVIAGEETADSVVVESLAVRPSKVVFGGLGERRKLLIEARLASGVQVDVTSLATVRTMSSVVTISDGYFLEAKQQGRALVEVSVGEAMARVHVEVLADEVPKVSFIKDVQPILGKLGCNAGTCHGSAKGKNGFKLSLRGYDPEFDYRSLVNDLSGRRFNRVNVDQSLMLMKPLGEAPHEGKQVLDVGSRYHRILRQWIVEGARFDEQVGGKHPERLEVLPKVVEMDLPDRLQHLVVLAHYADGSVRDVTGEAALTSNDTERAILEDGAVRGLRRGEAAILVRYDGLFATREVTILGDRTGYVWNDVPSYNYIDDRVYEKLKKVKVLPSELCTDEEFVRRVSLDLTGLPATPGRVERFLADGRGTQEKRNELIDELLGSDDYVEFWSNKWADLLQCNSETLGQRGVWVFREWIRDSIASNKPYNQFVRELLSASGSTYENPAANYYRSLRETGKMTEDVSQTFLGVRFNCNKCHDHPFEKWTQDQYYEFGAYFSSVNFKRGRLPGEEVVYVDYDGKELRHPKTAAVVTPATPFGLKANVQGTEDRRHPFIDWLTSRDNALFAKSISNRIWSYFTGRGIIEPVDDIRAGNPPSNPALLTALTERFVSDGFDLRALMRSICRSRTYQLSIRTNAWNEDDDINFSHAIPRRLQAEQLVDAVALATGSTVSMPGLPASMRSVQAPNGVVNGDEFLKLFGRPKRQSACECERTSNLSLAHAMSLVNGRFISDAVARPGNRIEQIVSKAERNQAIVRDIYLACLNRLPTSAEVEAIDLGEKEDRLESAQDLAWALINSPAFLFNR